ncbi:MAG: murein biosynthesis integral membrane protein MurJ [Candidatus Binatia bacterium]
MRSPGQRILRSTALLMGLTLTAKATGLLRDIIVAAQFGTSYQMDAFFVAGTIGSLMFVWLRGPIRVVLVPIFTEELTTRGERSAWENASILINTSIILLLILAGIGWLLSPYLVWLVAPGFTEETTILSIDLTRLMMLTLVFLGLAKLFSALFHSYQRFGLPGITSTVDNLVVIPSIIFLTPLVGIHGLVISAVLGTIAQALIQTPILWKNRSYYKPRINLRNPTLRRMARISLPLFIGVGGTRLGKVTDRIFASLLQPGSLSALAYGHQLTYTILEFLVASLTTVLFPFFSKTAGLQGYTELRKKLFKSLRTLFWIIFPLSIGILLLHEPLVRLVYHRGAFNEESLRLTSQAVFFYAIGLSAYSLSSVLSYTFFSLQDTKTPVVLGLVRLGIKIFLSVSLVGAMAHAGLALAESLSFVVKAALLLFFLPREIREAEYLKVFQSFGVTVVITGAMGAVLLFILPILERVFVVGASLVATSMGVGTAIAVGAGTYLIFSLLLQPTEIKDLFRFVRTGFGKP